MPTQTELQLAVGIAYLTSPSWDASARFGMARILCGRKHGDEMDRRRKELEARFNGASLMYLGMLAKHLNQKAYVVLDTRDAGFSRRVTVLELRRELSDFMAWLDGLVNKEIVGLGD